MADKQGKGKKDDEDKGKEDKDKGKGKDDEEMFRTCRRCGTGRYVRQGLCSKPRCASSLACSASFNSGLCSRFSSWRPPLTCVLAGGLLCTVSLLEASS